MDNFETDISVWDIPEDVLKECESGKGEDDDDK